MSNCDYVLHMFRRLQDNNYDIMLLCTGNKGSGKSLLSIRLVMNYLELFSFVCPHCGSEFYKNIYAQRKSASGRVEFYIPDYLKTGKAVIRCPEIFELDISTKQKKLKSGCGKTFEWGQRKRVPFSAEKFIAYDTKQLIDKLYSGTKGQPIIADEAYTALAGENHNKSENKFLKNVLNNVRPRNYFMIMNIPAFSHLDSKARETYSTFWLRMIDRGEAILFEKDKGETKDAYHTKEMEKVFGTLKFFTPLDKIKQKIRKHPCFFDMIQVAKIPDKIYDEYEYYRNALTIQRQIEEVSFDKKDQIKIVIWNFLNNWDRIKIAVDKTKNGRPTHNIVIEELAVDPLTKKPMFSDVTSRNWMTGIEKYIKSQGKEIGEFAKRDEDPASPVGDESTELTDVQL